MGNIDHPADHSRTICERPAFLAEEPTEDEFRKLRRQFGVHRYSSYTYFMWAQAYHLIKIGRSVDPSRRRLELRGEHNQEMEVVATVRGDFELSYHRLFEEHRFKGEWFNPAPEILAEIDRLQECAT